MDLSKKKRYDELIEEVEYIYNKLPIIMDADKGVMATILVASEHNNEDLGQLAGFIQKR